MSIMDDRLQHWMEQLNKAVVSFLPFSEHLIRLRLGMVDGPEAVVDARVQKAILTEIKTRLDTDPSFNQRFVAVPEWKILHQLLTAARLKELTRVHITKRGRSGGLRYDVSELSATFYGRQILSGLGFGKTKFSLTKEEFERVRGEFEKIKLTLPEAVDPTVTERFFAGEMD